MLKRILVAVVFVPLILVVMLLLPSVATSVMVAFIAALACYELLRAVADALPPILLGEAIVIAALIPLFTWLTGTLGLELRAAYLFGFLYMLLLFVYAIGSYRTQQEVSLDVIGMCMFAAVLMPGFLAALVELRVMDHGKLLILLPFVVAFLTDGGAYFAGVFLGKHRGITQVSPNKSLEGYIGGIAVGILACLIYGCILRLALGLSVRFVALIVYGVLGAFVTELGDLAFSLLKRQHGVKDYGNLLPGHGGMMDRFDSMVFAAPMILLLVQIYPFI